MTRLVNESTDFAKEALAGFAASNADRVLPVPGGVVRATASPAGQVAVVMGGGSGHFPAFAGWVGTGFGHGAACGNIFASPSEAQILSVARAADNGGGLLFAPINYAGDILNFTAAAERLRSEGLDVRLTPITDDIASGPAESPGSRRGIAGSFIVLKIVGAAVEEGRSLDEVEAIAIAANQATRSFGVAFSGCTFPGSAEPLFEVPAGRMAIGLGIHGEPGTSEADLGSAADVADLLVDGLFEERAPESGRAIAVLVNGLGTTKYDELFVVFDRVRERLDAAGMRLISPVVGEQVTSLDMAGVSLSLTYLDDDQESLWLAAADVYSFSRGVVGSRPARTLEVATDDSEEIPAASGPSRLAAERIAAASGAVLETLTEHEADLGAIDAVAGDGDHGAGMVRGARAAAAAATDASARGAGAGTLLARAGQAWSNEGGGTSGALWGAGLEAAARVLGDEDAPTGSTIVAAARAFRDEILGRGGAAPGEKTMVDAIVPFVAALEAGAPASPLAEAWTTAAAAARSAAEQTADIVSRRGRSRLHGERSIGTPDAGAISFALIVEHVAGA